MGDYPAFLPPLLSNEAADLWPDESELAELADRISEHLGGEIRRLDGRGANYAAQLAGETRGKLDKYLDGQDSEMAREILEEANELGQQKTDELVRVQAMLPNAEEGREPGGQLLYREFLDASVSHLRTMASNLAWHCKRIRKHGEAKPSEALDTLQEVAEILHLAGKAEKAASEEWS